MSGEVAQRVRKGSGRVPEVVLRTRRTVMEAAYTMKVQRARQRRHIGIALLVFAGLLVLATPALWSAVSELSAGEPFYDLPVMLVTLTLVLLSTVFAALLVTWRGRRLSGEER